QRDTHRRGSDHDVASQTRMNIPLLTTAVVLSLGALATVVVGREQDGVEGAAAEPLPVDELDLKRLARERRDSGIQDVFTSAAPTPPSPSVPLAVQKPEPPPAPTAPPLPFSYLGQMKKGSETIVYLLKNQELVLAQEGQTVETDYKVEGVTESAVQF